jgi:D-psicose/D-tagatose/L-ribulose 3-epimerase
MTQAHRWPVGALMPLQGLADMASAGYDFAELPCDQLRIEVSDDEFGRLRRQVSEAGLPVEVCSRFLPRDFKLVGPDVGWDRFTSCADTEMARAAAVGASVVLWANGPSRTVPDGFPVQRAFEQLVTAGRYIAGVARSHGLTVVFEGLNPASSNFILRLEEVLRLADAIGEPEIAVMADIFHMSRNAEPLTSIAQLGPSLRYVHVCDHDRRPPGTHPEEEPVYRELFSVLAAMGYAGRVSIEAEWDDVASQAGPALAVLRQAAAGSPAAS